MHIGDRVHMKDTGRAGTIAAGDEGDGTPVCTVAFDPTLDELIGVDIYEALTADRPYRPALPREEACAIMRDDLGAGICPDAFDALRGYLEREGPPAAPPP